MNRQILHTGLIAFSTIALLTAAIGRADTPATPDRPGRADAPQTPDHPTAPPANTSPGAPAGTTDEDLLKTTGADLDVQPQSLDKRILDWFGYRKKLEDAGLTLQGNWTIDESKNLRGGLNTEGDSLRNLFDLRLTVDTSAAFGWDGGKFSLDFQNQSGANGSDDLGDVQGYANADADGRTQISELWYEQTLLDDKLRIKLGKVDSNTEFAFPENGAAFINSSFGHSPTVIDMPTYPDPSTSINVFVYPTRELYFGVGVYDGSIQNGTNTGSYGPARLLHSNRAIFYIAEAGYRWQLNDDTLPGKFAIGGHYNDGDFDKFNGGTQSGAGGFYANLDQKLWHKKFYDKGNEEGVYSFLQYGHADADVNEVADYFGAGITWVGPFDKENPDTIGLGVAAAHLSNRAGAGFTEDYETSIELFYNFQATEYLSIKPDLQYIIHPGGDESLDDALVATIRLTLAF